MKNIVFDIGNVLVKWSPKDIVATLFPNAPDENLIINTLFNSKIWFDLNLGKLTGKEAVQLYKSKLPSKAKQLDNLMEVMKNSLVPVEGGFELLEKARSSGRHVYALSDNVKEFVVFLKKEYNFFKKLNGAVISAEVGVLKPSPKIYQILLEKYQLIPSETIFLDDVEKNVIGAQKAGMHSVQFTSAKECENILQYKYKVVF